jgi:tetratricopeptide (TPR) repeat protein
MIVAIAVTLAALIGTGVYFLRGKSEPTGPAKAAEPTPAGAAPAPSEEPAALVPKAGFEPPARPIPAAKPAEKPEKPARAEKPAPAEKPEKPAHAEKPARAEKPAAAEKPAVPEAKAPGGKPSEEDFRRANEAYASGNAKLFQGKTADAIAEFGQALKLNPKDPAIHRGLGLAYAQAGKSAEATKHLKLYLKASPKATDRAIIEKRIDQLHGR